MATSCSAQRIRDLANADLVRFTIDRIAQLLHFIAIGDIALLS